MMARFTPAPGGDEALADEQWVRNNKTITFKPVNVVVADNFFRSHTAHVPPTTTKITRTAMLALRAGEQIKH